MSKTKRNTPRHENISVNNDTNILKVMSFNRRRSANSSLDNIESELFDLKMSKLNFSIL